MKKVALVTGGARGIGRAIAKELGRDHRIAYTWLSSEPREDTNTTASLPIRSDLTQADQPEAVVSQVLEKFGRLDVIVNNAGLVKTTPKETFTPDDHRAIFDVNLLVPAALLSAALPHLRPGASIVSVSSVNATLPPQNAVSYGASKAALNLWTRAMAKELGPDGIRVNAVAPARSTSPRHPGPKSRSDRSSRTPRWAGSEPPRTLPKLSVFYRQAMPHSSPAKF